MQTFLPYFDYDRVAATLDYRRLGKQRVECKQMLMALLGETAAWRNHPCTRMWDGHELWLILYASAMCREWRRRGYVDNLLPYFVNKRTELLRTREKHPAPWWHDDIRITITHRSNLLRKLPEHYRQFPWGPLRNDLPYHWPQRPWPFNTPRPTFQLANWDATTGTLR